jgi:tetratricopeptide (TPR) repeat protein
MTDELSRISVTARRAVKYQDWSTVDACATEILRRDNSSAEGYFLAGLVQRAMNKPAKAAQSFRKALDIDADRYDAAVELANQLSIARHNGEAADLLSKYTAKLANSPMYLDLAGSIYNDIGMPQKAWSLFKSATELQPGVDLFQANLATCSVFLGKIDEARAIYQELLQRFPGHRSNHYQLSRLESAKNSTHVDQMKEILSTSDDPPDKNIFLYYAIAKELEDLEQWEESFKYYKKAGDAVTSVAKYDVADDVQLISTIIDVCNSEWLASESGGSQADDSEKTPIFIVGLPRTGTTLTERIVSSHSQVESVGETQFLQMVLRQESAIQSIEKMNPAMVEALAHKDMRRIASGYMNTVNYRLSDKPMFIDKLPFNFLFLGFIARAYPHAKIIHLSRNPMDTCFSMYKQVFTWAYKFSYSLDNLGQYYVAYDRMRSHWRDILQDRLIEVEYESLVTDQEGQTRILLERLGLEFEEDCLHFDKNTAPSATASSVQVRQKVHARSVDKWTRFAHQLQPLKEHLQNAGITVD